MRPKGLSAKRGRKIVALAAFQAVAWAAPGGADPFAEACLGALATPLGDEARVDGLEIIIGDRPATMRLAGLVDDDWPPRARAVAAWRGADAPFVAPASGAKPDRYGRQPVFLMTKSRPRALQEALLASGDARLHHRDLEPECAARLARLEDEAIAARRGIWADPRHGILDSRDPDMMLPRIDSYQVVEGPLLSVGRTARRLYLNFGRYWAEDFTVEIGKRAESALSKAGKVPDDWVGARVRVRGWLSESRGPVMTIESANQIERLTD